jgi:exodeoxyribonuclease-3
MASQAAAGTSAIDCKNRTEVPTRPHPLLACAQEGRYSASMMRIASWNVNSVAARLPRLLAWLAAERPDVVCLQETKTRDEAFPHGPLLEAGYVALIRGEKSYNGVAILTRADAPRPTLLSQSLAGVTRGSQAMDESRFLLARVGGVGVASVYVPNGRELDTEHEQYKSSFYRALLGLCQEAIGKNKPLLVAGDFNVAPRDEDVHNPAHWAKGVLYHPRMRALLEQLLQAGMVDCLPKHDPRPGLYSWWDYRHLAFAKDNGLRIDLLLASPALAAHSTGAGVHRDMRKGERPSDHVPVWASFSLG